MVTFGGFSHFAKDNVANAVGLVVTRRDNLSNLCYSYAKGHNMSPKLAQKNKFLCPWDPHTWIQKGKIYPSSDTPLFIQEAHSRALAIPAECATLLPDKTLSINELMDMDLPSRPEALVSHKAEKSFSKELPNTSSAHLATLSIPPKHYIQNLEKAFGQAWFDGSQSIVDFRNKLSWLPLWTITYWKEMSLVLEKREIWRKANEWLAKWEKHSKTLDEADKVHCMMTDLNWSSDITALGAACPKHNLA